MFVPDRLRPDPSVDGRVDQENHGGHGELDVSGSGLRDRSRTGGCRPRSPGCTRVVQQEVFQVRQRAVPAHRLDQEAPGHGRKMDPGQERPTRHGQAAEQDDADEEKVQEQDGIGTAN